MSENVIVWIHGDCLSPTNPALAAYSDSPALFVWDEALLVERRISLKRVVFMYECLLEMPVTIRKGVVEEEIGRFAAEHEASKIVTTSSPSPRFSALCESLKAQGMVVEVLELPSFVEPAAVLDLKRFSRYWRKVQNDAFIPR